MTKLLFEFIDGVFTITGYFIAGLLTVIGLAVAFSYYPITTAVLLTLVLLGVFSAYIEKRVQFSHQPPKWLLARHPKLRTLQHAFWHGFKQSK